MVDLASKNYCGGGGERAPEPSRFRGLGDIIIVLSNERNVMHNVRFGAS